MPHLSAEAVRPDADDCSQVVRRDVAFIYRAGASGNCGNQGRNVRVPGRKAAFAVLVGNRVAHGRDGNQVHDAQHIGEEFALAHLSPGLLHGLNRRQLQPGVLRDRVADDLMVGHFVSGFIRRRPQDDIPVKILFSISDISGWVRADQVEMVSPLR